MISWWNWKHLKDVQTDVNELKAHAQKQLVMKDAAYDLRKEVYQWLDG